MSVRCSPAKTRSDIRSGTILGRWCTDVNNLHSWRHIRHGLWRNYIIIFLSELNINASLGDDVNIVALFSIIIICSLSTKRITWGFMHFQRFHVWSSWVFFFIIIVCVISRLGAHTYISILNDIKGCLYNSLKLMFIKLKKKWRHSYASIWWCHSLVLLWRRFLSSWTNKSNACLPTTYLVWNQTLQKYVVN